MTQSVSGTAAKISEVKMLIFNALKQSSRIITKANPPPTTQIVPNMNPMSITMPNADEAPDERLPVVCARMGVNPIRLF